MNSTGNDGGMKPAATWLDGLSRRTFLRRGTITAAAVGIAGSVPGLSGLLASGASEAPAAGADASELDSEAGALTEPLVAHVKDLSSGEISLFQGEREVLVRDPALARRLVSSARP